MKNMIKYFAVLMACMALPAIAGYNPIVTSNKACRLKKNAGELLRSNYKESDIFLRGETIYFILDFDSGKKGSMTAYVGVTQIEGSGAGSTVDIGTSTTVYDSFDPTVYPAEWATSGTTGGDSYKGLASTTEMEEAGIEPFESREFGILELVGIVAERGGVPLANGSSQVSHASACAVARVIESSVTPAIDTFEMVVLKAVLNPPMPEWEVGELGEPPAESVPEGLINWSGGEDAGRYGGLYRFVRNTTFAKTKASIIPTALDGLPFWTMNVYSIGAVPSSFSPKNGISGSYSSNNSEALAGSTGIETDVSHNYCEIGFKVQPDELVEDEHYGYISCSNIKWDVTREKCKLEYWKGSGQWNMATWSDSFFDSNPDDWKNDDRSDASEDNNPWDGNGYLFAIDTPGLHSTSSTHEGEIKLLNMREYVLVTFDPLGIEESGLRCSDYSYWHSFHALKFVGGVAERDTNFTNEIKPGLDFWGDYELPYIYINEDADTLPDGTEGQLYEPDTFTYTGSGHTKPVTWSLMRYCAGLQLQQSGESAALTGNVVLSGAETPVDSTTVQTTAIIRVQDANGLRQIRYFPLMIRK